MSRSRVHRRTATSDSNKPVAPGLFLTILSFIIFALGILVLFAKMWSHRTWPGLTIDEMVYHLTAPVEGTGSGIFTSLFLQVFLPAAVVEAAAVVAAVIVRRKHPRIYRFIILSEIVSSVLMIVISVLLFSKETNLSGYIDSQNSDSDFIETHYADPVSTDIVFPQKKRNLIYIYLESMEMTYADKADGGAFDENVIPELTDLAQTNECFAGKSGVLNGGIVYPNTGYTMAGIFAQSSGAPLQTSITRNNMDTQSSFFFGMTTLGDLLDQEGYRQVFLLGSDATFGGRRLFFNDHGNSEIRDYNWAKDTGLIPSDYFQWWGYEDEKLFSFAKKTLTELAEGDQPFNLTMLTVDTHFEDGYVCELCGDRFGDNQYANVIACSSSQLWNFVRWVQKQDFYDNTTIVLSGDHTTMDSDFCNDVDPDYQRKTYVCYINPGTENELPDQKRDYATIDLFPTTVAALGAKISGNQLGLGVNLFSSQQTLTEQYGEETMKQEMSNKSDFLLNKSDVTITDAMKERIGDDVFSSFGQGTYPDTMHVTIFNIQMDAERAEVTYTTSTDRTAADAITVPMHDFRIESDAADTRDASNGYKADIVIPSACSRLHCWFTLYYPDGTVVVSRIHTAIMKQALGDAYDDVMQRAGSGQTGFILPEQTEESTASIPSLATGMSTK